MRKIDNSEMKKINGGGNGILISTAITGLITFFIGILSGYSNPQECKIKES